VSWGGEARDLSLTRPRYGRRACSDALPIDGVVALLPERASPTPIDQSHRVRRRNGAGIVTEEKERPVAFWQPETGGQIPIGREDNSKFQESTISRPELALLPELASPTPILLQFVGAHTQ
jgi:hypothetical protein